MTSSKRRLVSLDVFEALRRDTSLTPADDIPVAVRPEWVWAAQILTRLSKPRVDARARKQYVAAVDQLAPRSADPPDTTRRAFDDLLAALRENITSRALSRISNAAAQLIDDADSYGFDSISDALASSALDMCQKAPPAAHFAVLWRAGRARRKTGDLATAEKYYKRVKALGQRRRDHAAIARGALGLGIVARGRGNIDEMIRLFELAHTHAQRSKSREIQIQAHQGMEIAAGILGDHAGEVRHVWLAYSLSVGDPAHELEALHNVAWYACQAGIASDALPALLAVLENRQMKPALRLHFLGTTANAAAQCGRRDILERIREEIARVQDSAAHPYEYGIALISVSEALEWLGEPSLARQYRNEARSLGARLGLRELLHRSVTPSIRSAVASTMDAETAAELGEVRRALHTIAAGVLGSDEPIEGEGASGASQGDRA